MVAVTSLLAGCDDDGLRRLTASLSRAVGEELVFDMRGDWRSRLEALRRGEFAGGFVCGGVVGDHPELVPVAAPVYRGFDRPIYCSELLVADHSQVRDWRDLAGARLAINEPESHSGVVHVKTFLAEQGVGGGFFGAVVESGSHAASMELVATGQADAAAIDSHVWDLDGRAELRSIAEIGLSPSPPFATHVAVGEPLRAELAAALAVLHDEEQAAMALRSLGITRFVGVGDDRYAQLGALRATLRSVRLA